MTTQYALGLGTKTNNDVEAISLFKGLMILISMNIWEVMVLGESRITINLMHNQTKTKNYLLNHHILRVRILIKKIYSKITFKHIPQELNFIVYSQANKFVTLLEGSLSSLEIMYDTLHVP